MARNMSEANRIFLVDDDDAVRDALGLYLEREQFTVDKYQSAEALLEVISDNDSGVLVLDLRMDGMSGLELQKQLKARGMALPIIFITGHGNVQNSVSAMKEGATDFIEKPFENEALLESIHKAQREEDILKQQRFQKSRLLEKYQDLTSREKEVMEYVVEGVSNKQLAVLLDVSNRTIEVHRSRVMKKMGATSLPELVRMSLLMEANGS